ncbi:MAG: hypothetical protein QF911_03040 [Candidatus Thalassarchaeaceae archaeon]|nr:hypothetical protein [Candidatus Thalassarchaeaceae archaeon]
MMTGMINAIIAYFFLSALLGIYTIHQINLLEDLLARVEGPEPKSDE